MGSIPTRNCSHPNQELPQTHAATALHWLLLPGVSFIASAAGTWEGTQREGHQDILRSSSWWMEKTGFWSECGRALKSLLRISGDGRV